MIGKKLRSLREKKGLTQEQVADYLHISQSAYARMERGKSNSWASHLKPLAKLFETFPSELIYDTDNLVLNQKAKDNAVNNGYTINQLSKKLIDQYEAKIAQYEVITAEKDAALTKQNAIINELRERLEKESK